LAKEFVGPITVLPWQDRHDAIDGVAMLVNATSQGMVGQAALDLRLDKLPKTALVNDIIYIPRQTPLIEAAQARGNRTVTGLGMLLHQGIPAWRAWFGIEPKVTADLRAKIEATL
jgi:shikimate dehydrogenase